MKFEFDSLENLQIQLIDGDRGKNYPSQENFSKAGYCLFLSAKNVTKSGFDFSEKIYVDKDRDELLRAGKLQREDIILTTRGTIGNVAYFSPTVPYENIRINSGMLIVRANQERWNPRFLYFLFNSNIVKDQIVALTSGSAVPQLPAKDIKKFQLPRIPKSIQNNIDEIIGNITEKIHLNTQTNQTLESIAQAIFKSWFVDFEPVKAKMAALAEGGTREQAELAAMGAISGKSEAELAQLQQQNPEHYQQLAETAALFPSAMVESELGEIPEGWEVEPLSNHINIKHGFAFKGEYFSDSPTNLILVTPGNFRVGGGFKNDKLKFYNGPIPESFVFHSNDLMITMTDLSKEADTLGYPALIPSSNTHKYLHNQRIGKVEFIKDAEIKNFMYQFFCSDFYRNEVLSGITGSTVKHTAPKKILSIKIAIDARIAKIFSVNVNALFKKIPN